MLKPMPSLRNSIPLLAISCIVLVACSPTPDSSNSEDPATAEALALQAQRYDQQMEITDRQLAENDKLLARQHEINDRMLRLIERWERQADRVDAMLAKAGSSAKRRDVSQQSDSP